MLAFRASSAVLVAAALLSGCSPSRSLSANEKATTLHVTYEDDLSFVSQHLRSIGCQPALNAEPSDDARLACSTHRSDGQPLDVQVSLYELSGGRVAAVASAWVQSGGSWRPVQLGDETAADVRGTLEALLIRDQLIAEAAYVQRPPTR